MSNLGMGVMINMLSDDPEARAVWPSSKGKRIASIVLQDDALRLRFEDGTGMALSDQGQSCCEHRYMTCDDDLSSFAGAELVEIEMSDVTTKEDAYETHEMQFLNVKTTKGVITCETHNEHNGYYGGFYLTARAW